MREVDFEGDFAAFLAFLRSDPQFYADDVQTYLHRVAWIGKTIEARLPQFFSRLPSNPLRHQRDSRTDRAPDSHGLLPAGRRGRHPCRPSTS